MKWLILIALFSCGQKNPPAKDVSDSDGDQILNYQEVDSELHKYVAEVIPFPETIGTLTFKVDSKYVSVKLSNNHNIAGNAMKLITKSLSAIRTKDYFSEWSVLKPEASAFVLAEDSYDVTLSLDTTQMPEAISLTDGKSEIEIGKYSKRLEFRVTAEELRQVLSGNLHLNLKKTHNNPYSVESTIRDRTYRVFFFDGRISKIHYVSNELSFQEYLKLSGIKESYELKNFRGFSHADAKLFWWTRNVGDRDKIVVKSSLKELAKFNLSNYELKNTTMNRSNGSISNVLTLTKAPDTKLVLRIRGTKTQNIFSERTDKFVRGGQHAADMCERWIRSVNKTKTHKVTKLDLLSGLKLSSEGKQLDLISLADEVTAGEDANGWYLEIALDKTPEHFSFFVAPRHQSTYVKTGVYKTVCDYGAPVYSGINTNEEGQLNLQLESFIEKID